VPVLNVQQRVRTFATDELKKALVGKKDASQVALAFHLLYGLQAPSLLSRETANNDRRGCITDSGLDGPPPTHLFGHECASPGDIKRHRLASYASVIQPHARTPHANTFNTPPTLPSSHSSSLTPLAYPSRFPLNVSFSFVPPFCCCPADAIGVPTLETAAERPSPGVEASKSWSSGCFSVSSLSFVTAVACDRSGS